MIKNTQNSAVSSKKKTLSPNKKASHKPIKSTHVMSKEKVTKDSIRKDHVTEDDNSMREAREISVDKRVVKSCALTKKDMDNIQQVKEKCLNKRMVVNDSHVIRLGIELVARLSEAALVEEFKKIQIVYAGRPRKG